ATLEPRGSAEEALFVEAQERRRQRLGRLTRRRAGALDPADEPDDKPRWALESSRAVLPEDTLFGHTMFPGKLLMDIDEAGGILSMRYCKGVVVSACLHAIDLYSTIVTHQEGMLQ